jgi:hypothetical protein
MTKRIKTAFASLAVATLCTLGASSQASAFDLLEELMGGTKYADSDSCGCSQKNGGHVQRCGAGCGSKGLKGHAQRSGGKGLAGHVQHTGIKGGSCGGHAQRSGCKGGHFGGHAQRSSCGSCGKSGGCGCGSKVGKKGGSSKSAGHHADLYTMMRAKMASMKCKLSSHHAKGGKGANKGFDLDAKAGSYSEPMIVPAPMIREGIQSVPVPPNPDQTT